MTTNSKKDTASAPEDLGRPRLDWQAPEGGLEKELARARAQALALWPEVTVEKAINDRHDTGGRSEWARKELFRSLYVLNPAARWLARGAVRLGALDLIAPLCGSRTRRSPWDAGSTHEVPVLMKGLWRRAALSGYSGSCAAADGGDIHGVPRVDDLVSAIFTAIPAYLRSPDSILISGDRFASTEAAGLTSRHSGSSREWENAMRGVKKACDAFVGAVLAAHSAPVAQLRRGSVPHVRALATSISLSSPRGEPIESSDDEIIPTTVAVCVRSRPDVDIVDLSAPAASSYRVTTWRKTSGGESYYAVSEKALEGRKDSLSIVWSRWVVSEHEIKEALHTHQIADAMARAKAKR